MTPKNICLIAVDPDGDHEAARLAALLREELAQAGTEYGENLLPLHVSLEPNLWGIGGPAMAQEGIETIRHFEEADRSNLLARRFLRQMSSDAVEAILDREPHAIIFVGSSESFAGISRRIKEHSRDLEGTFNNWEPLIFQLTRDSQTHDSNCRDAVQLDSHDLSSAAQAIVKLLFENDEHFPLRAHLH